MNIKKHLIKENYSYGPAYITPEGQIINDIKSTHLDLYNIIAKDNNLELNNLEYLLEELGWIRLNTNLNFNLGTFIDIRKPLSSNQINSLESILYAQMNLNIEHI